MSVMTKTSVRPTVEISSMNKNARLQSSKARNRAKRIKIVNVSKYVRFVGKIAFFAPWRKIRRWTQAQCNSIHFEIYFTQELEFHWLEIETEQAPYLMAVVAEFIYLMKKDTEEPEPRARGWWKETRRRKLTWKLIKKELFGKGKADDDEEDEDEVDLSDSEQIIEKFDDLKEEASTDEEISEGEGEGGEAAARSQRRGSGYLFHT